MKKDILEQNRQNIISAYENGESTVSLGKKYNVNNAYIYLFLRDECGVQMREHKKNYEKYKEEIVKLNSDGMSVLAIGKKLDIPPASMHRLGKKWGLAFKPTAAKNMDQYADEIIDLYKGGMGCTLLSQQYECSESTILNLLQRKDVETGINHRKYHFDERFFEKIDTPEKAYIVGFVAGDGSQDGNDLRIAITDLELLEKIKIVMDLDIPIKDIKPRSPSHKPQYLLAICSRIMCKDLDRLGLVKNKTFKICFPTEEQVPDKLLRHFLRGLYDADGTICIQKNRKMTQYIGYIGNGPLMDGLNTYIDSILNFKFLIIDKHKKYNGDIRHLRCRDIEQILTFLDWLYDGSTIHLNRKYQKYLELKAKFTTGG